MSFITNLKNWLLTLKNRITITNNSIEKLRDEFFSNFLYKYELKSNNSLGEGHYACVFSAYDKDRKIDVAIKIFFDGIAPAGSQRGWHITSSVVHNQIAQTSTIETFYSKTLKRECKAVVQRFIPGKTLKSLLNKFDKIESNPNYQNVLNDFASTYLTSLLSILNFCHNQGFGHGDCHDGNIMVFMESHQTRHSFRVVLIDFDNASIKETLNLLTEREKIESDIGLLKYFYNKAFYQWNYFNPVRELFNSYKTMTEFQFSYSIVLTFVDLCIKSKTSPADIALVFNKLPHPFMGFHIPPTVQCLREIAVIASIEANFNTALDNYKAKISDLNNWDTEVTIEYLNDGVTQIYRDLFDN